MGLEDREWYREAQREKQALSGAQKDQARRAAHARSPLDDLIARTNREHRGMSLAQKAGLLVLLCLAVVGALALVRHFAG